MPAVRLCVVILLGHVALVRSAPFLHPYAPPLAVLCLLLTVTYALRRAWPAARALGCASIALMLATTSTSSYIPTSVNRSTVGFGQTARINGFEQSARIDGYVTRVLSQRPRAVRLLLEGEVDSKHFPAFRTRVAVTVFCDSGVGGGKEAIVATQGCRVVIYARIRQPSRSTLPGEFDEQAMCSSMQVSFVGTANLRDLDIRAQAPVTRVVVGQVQNAITHALRAHVEPEVAAVLRAVIIGDGEDIQPESRKAYALSGTAHMFSVSGSHVAILLALGLAITVAIRRRWLRAVLLLCCIVGYVVISGGSAPAWRAAVMGLLALWGRNTERHVVGLNILAVAVLCMTIHDPSLPWSAGFQLSVCATAAILVLAPNWNSLLKRCTLRDNVVKRYLRVSCAVTLAASAGIALPSALIFSQVALWSPVANLFVVPILSIAMVTGSGLVLVHYVAPWLAPSVGWVCSCLVHAADTAAYVFAHLQPDRVSASHVVANVALTLGLCVWPLVATGWVGIFSRQAACVATMVCVMFVPAPPQSVVQEYLRPSGSIVVIRAAHRTVILTSLQRRDVGVERYVKCLPGKIDWLHRPRASLYQ